MIPSSGNAYLPCDPSALAGLYTTLQDPICLLTTETDESKSVRGDERQAVGIAWRCGRGDGCSPSGAVLRHTVLPDTSVMDLAAAVGEPHLPRRHGSAAIRGQARALNNTGLRSSRLRALPGNPRRAVRPRGRLRTSPRGTRRRPGERSVAGCALSPGRNALQ